MNRRRGLILGLLTVAMLLAVGSAGADISVLDPSFGLGTGRVTTAIGASAAADSLVLQPDEKIVAAGAVVQADTTQDFALARYQSDGSLDPTFGSGGIVQTPTGAVRAVALQPDGKIVAAGTTYADVRVARYDADGSLDVSFGTGGVVTTPIGTGAADAKALVLQPDGKVVVGGESSNGSQTVFTLVRYTADGSPDSTFGSGGIVTTQVGTGSSAVTGLALQPDGKIVAEGDAVAGSSQGVPGLARYETGGSLDSTFGSGGVVTTPVLGGDNVTPGPVVLQPDGKIVVGATSPVGFAVIRYETDGSVDTGFDDGGVASLGLGPGNHVTGLALQPDGKILVAGAASFDSNSPGLLLINRRNGNGSLDTSFAGSGLAAFNEWTGATGNPPPPASPAIALQPDGKIAAASSSSADGGSTQQFLLARFGASTLTVNLGANPWGAGGDITSNPPGIDCTADYACILPDYFTWEHAFGAGPVTLTAIPRDGFIFAGWSGGGCSGTGTCLVHMSGGITDDQMVSADFIPAPTKALTVTKTGTGAGLVTTSGLYCRRTCAHGFVVGSTVTLTAQPTSKWSRFRGWSGDCSGKGTCTVTMDTNHSVTAGFQHFCIVPRLKGKTLRAAKRSARSAHCLLGKVRLVTSSKVKRGRVVSTKPASRRRLVGRSRLRLEISRGSRHR
jgi:uncharacterized delta-60 repeat protein